VDGYIVDETQRKVFVENQEIDLTTKEFELLMLFIKNKGTAFSRSQILDSVWEVNYYGSDRVVDDTMRRLRKKMPDFNVTTIYGFGYRWG
jgi:two-component system response regulator CssR